MYSYVYGVLCGLVLHTPVSVSGSAEVLGGSTTL